MFLYSMINKLCNYICSRQKKGKCTVCVCLSYICIKQVYQNVTDAAMGFAYHILTVSYYLVNFLFLLKIIYPI